MPRLLPELAVVCPSVRSLVLFACAGAATRNAAQRGREGAPTLCNAELREPRMMMPSSRGTHAPLPPGLPPYRLSSFSMSRPWLCQRRCPLLKAPCVSVVSPAIDGLVVRFSNERNSWYCKWIEFWKIPGDMGMIGRKSGVWRAKVRSTASGGPPFC